MTMFRAVTKVGTSLHFDTEHAMRQQAPRVARYLAGDLRLQRSDATALPGSDEWIDLETIAWDGHPADPNPTKRVEYTFAARVVAHVRQYDSDGVERDLPEAIRGAVLDVLGYELDEPDQDDLVQVVEEVGLTQFTVTRIVPL